MTSSKAVHVALALASAFLLGRTLGFSHQEDQLRGAAASTTPCRVQGHGDVMHGQQIERADPCEFCICIDSNVFCWWGQLHCAASKAQAARDVDNATADSRLVLTESSASPSPEREDVNGANTNTTCTVMGREYASGATLPRETGTCLECVCGRGGRVTCSPRDCVKLGDAADDAADDTADPNAEASLDMFDVDVF